MRVNFHTRFITIPFCSTLQSHSSNSLLPLSHPISLTWFLCIINFFLTGEYSCLKVDLIFKREFSYYLIQIYIPCCMLVIVSWVSFWLDPNAIPARVSLGVTTLLTMATQISGINASLPPVSYTKAIDVWTGSCLTFVFGALLEFALVNYASRSDAHRAAAKKAAAAVMAAQRKNLVEEEYDAGGFENGVGVSFARIEVRNLLISSCCKSIPSAYSCLTFFLSLSSHTFLLNSTPSSNL